MIPTEIDYSVRRERQERRASLAATDTAVRASHDAMADRYADRAFAAAAIVATAGNP